MFVRGQVVSAHTGNGVPGHVLLTFHGPNGTIDNTITVPITQDGWFSSEDQRWVKKFRAKELSLHYPGVPGTRPVIPTRTATRSDQGRSYGRGLRLARTAATNVDFGVATHDASQAP